MSRRDKVIALLCIEALVWLGVGAIQTFSGAHIALENGVVVAIFGLVSLALLFLPAILIGMLSRQWQAAIALNVIAILPAVALAAVASPYQRFPAFGMQGFTFVGAIAALGFFGWLLRFVRAEFSA